MSLVLPDPFPCPFDWDGEENKRLKGGRLLKATAHRFAYAFFNDFGHMQRAIIAGKQHGEDMATLLWTHADENAELHQLVLHQLRGAPHNMYVSIGQVAGESVFDHAHLHVLPRYADDFACSLGLRALLAKYNEVLPAYQKLRDRYDWQSGT